MKGLLNQKEFYQILKSTNNIKIKSTIIKNLVWLLRFLKY